MPAIHSLTNILRAEPWRFALLHSAPSARVIWTTKGQGRALVGAERCGIGTHNFIYIPANRSFSLDAGSQLGGYLLEADIQDRMGRNMWPDMPLLLRLRDVREQNTVTGLIDAARHEQDADLPFRDDAMQAHMRLISIWLRRQMTVNARKPSAAQRLITAFLNDLERNFTAGEPMAAYAERLHVTPTHLSRVCKSTLGRSAADLIVERTLFAARDRLETTTLSAKTIAAELGFGSPAYFTRFIQSHTGNTPRALRQKCGARQR